MGSGSSNRSSNSSIKSQNNKRCTPENPLSPEPVDARDKSPQPPSGAWSIWRGRNDSTGQPSSTGSAQVDTGNTSGWWRKSSITSLRGFTRTEPDSTAGNGSVSTAVESQEPALDEPRKRAWSFWNRKSAECEQNQPAEVANAQPNNVTVIKPIINEIITGVSDDAILYKKKSKDDTAAEQILEGKNEEQGHVSNILTPSFEILPELTFLSSFYSNLGKYGHKWNLLAEGKLA